MALLDKSQHKFANAISGLIYCNPFLPERIEHEKAALGRAFITGAQPWNVSPEGQDQQVNIGLILNRAESMIETIRTRLLKPSHVTEADLGSYEDLALFVLYHRFAPAFKDIVSYGSEKDANGRPRFPFYRRFVAEAMHLLDLPGRPLAGEDELRHLFACFFQIRRAYDHIFKCILGISEPAVRLRAQAWQSIFTHDMRRFRRILYDRMGDITTLVTGPSGTGKELVARAIGLSRYIPFDSSSQRFAGDFAGSFHALNLSALSPTLIESELFGHRKGSFTGALSDHSGWLEVCTASGTVFLDEIGDLDTSIQVKLLRVLQDGAFQRIGDTATLTFQGKIIAATNRDLAREMQAGRFRNDLYYRLCSDIITTPSLRDQLDHDPEELRHLTESIARRLVSEDDSALVDEVLTWIEANLGPDYDWPGNIRELEQCVRNVLVRGEYQPAPSPSPRQTDERDAIAREICAGNLTAEEMLRRYCTLVYAQTGSYVETARRLGLDRRTVRVRVDDDLLLRLTAR